MVALAWKSVATGTAVVSAGVREDLDATLAYQRLRVSKSVSVRVRALVRAQGAEGWKGGLGGVGLSSAAPRNPRYMSLYGLLVSPNSQTEAQLGTTEEVGRAFALAT